MKEKKILTLEEAFLDYLEKSEQFLMAAMQDNEVMAVKQNVRILV
jgi:hypothetical protein